MNTVKIDIDPNEIFSNTTAREDTEFIDYNIDKASDDKIVDEVFSRNLVDDVMCRLDSAKLEEIRKNYFDD
jgi:hypothetical protein